MSEIKELENITWKKEKPENFNYLKTGIQNQVDFLVGNDLEQKELSIENQENILNYCINFFKKNKKISSNDFQKMISFLKKNFSNILEHDFIGKLSLFSLNINQIESGKKEYIEEKNLNKLIYFLEYALAFIGKKSETEINLEDFSNFIKNDILSYFGEKYNSGKIKISYKDGEKYKNKNIKINIYNSINSIDKKIKINKGDFYFLIINIIKNAVKHGNASKLEIILEEKKDFLEIKINDNGTGIKGFNNLNQIFELGQTTNGTGIGIGKAKERMALNNGEISVKNTNSGTSFKINFPLINKF